MVEVCGGAPLGTGMVEACEARCEGAPWHESLCACIAPLSVVGMARGAAVLFNGLDAKL